MSDSNAYPTRNLHQRIAAITGEAQIKVTGENERRKPAISIADVDAALGDLMAKHGVVSDYDYADEPRVLYELPTRNEGVLRIWQVHIWGIIANADEPSDEMRRSLWDIGSSPSGAVSFALKRWLKALFKLAEEEADERRIAAGENGAHSAAGGGETPSGPARTDTRQIVCPKCGEKGAVSEYRDPAAHGGNRFYCAKNRETTTGKNGCGQAFNLHAVEDEPDAMPAVTDDERRTLEALAACLPKTSKDRAWVHDQLSRVTARSLNAALQKQHREQCGPGCSHTLGDVRYDLPGDAEDLAAEPVADEQDPDDAVCPHCGKADTLGQKQDGGFRCKVSSGGCGKSFPTPVRRSEFVQQESLA